jgi:hypothetical protein
MTTTKNAIDNNIFGLYSNEKEYQVATIEIKEAADKLIELMREYRSIGAQDTESRDAITYYISNNI